MVKPPFPGKKSHLRRFFLGSWLRRSPTHFTQTQGPIISLFFRTLLPWISSIHSQRALLLDSATLLTFHRFYTLFSTFFGLNRSLRLIQLNSRLFLRDFVEKFWRASSRGVENFWELFRIFAICRSEFTLEKSNLFFIFLFLGFHVLFKTHHSLEIKMGEILNPGAGQKKEPKSTDFNFSFSSFRSIFSFFTRP